MSYIKVKNKNLYYYLYSFLVLIIASPIVFISLNFLYNNDNILYFLILISASIFVNIVFLLIMFVFIKKDPKNIVIKNNILILNYFPPGERSIIIKDSDILRVKIKKNYSKYNINMYLNNRILFLNNMPEYIYKPINGWLKDNNKK